MSTSCFDREDGVFKVLVNHEEQYSLWPEWKGIPGGWSETGVQGDKKTCLEYVEKTWTDMRPLSLRQWMAEQDAKKQAQKQSPNGTQNTAVAG